MPFRSPDGAGVEGDQIALGTKRTESFWNRKIILGSTPTIKGVSRIEKSWSESDQRRFHVACPHCGHAQVLKWQNLHWKRDVDEAGKTIAHHPETAHFVCEAKGCVIEEHDKPAMVDAGAWVAGAPSKGHAGFHIWAAYSLFPNAAWRYLVEEFLRVHKDPSLLQTFVNLVLGETWDEPAERVDTNSLLNRAETYDALTLPQGAVVVTAGVDVQDDRLEIQVIAWGAGEESWPCLYEVLHGDPAQPKVWDELDGILNETFQSDNGQRLKIRAACIDTGGHHGERVYAFCKTRRMRRVFPIKGVQGPRPVWPKRASRGKANETLFAIGVDTAKDAIYGRLRIQKPGPGYVHFPADDAFNDDYFAQLTVERVLTRYRQGRPYRVWDCPKGKRNEALDTFVYALAALKSLPIRFDRKLVEAQTVDDQDPDIDDDENSDVVREVHKAPPVYIDTVVQRKSRLVRRTSRSNYMR